MALTGAPLLVVLAVLVLGLSVALLALFNRVRGPAPVRVAQRVLLLLTAQVCVVALAAACLNDSFGFFDSWQDLLGAHAVPGLLAGAGSTPSDGHVGAGASRHSVDRAAATAFRRVPDAGDMGIVLQADVTGSASHVRSPVWVWLPPEYDQPAYRHHLFPVVELFPGYPGTPTTWLHAMRLPEVFATSVRAHQVAPFVGVLAPTTVAPPRDTQCQDVVGGPAVETFLAVDVPRTVLGGFRVRADPAGWSTMGYSEGGYCALVVAVRHPDRFGSAVSLSGTANAFTTSQSGDLFGGSRALRERADVVWRLRHLTPPHQALLLTASRSEPEELAALEAVAAAARPPTTVATDVLPHGGHNTFVWSALLPRALAWLDARWSAAAYAAG